MTTCKIWSFFVLISRFFQLWLLLLYLYASNRRYMPISTLFRHYNTSFFNVVDLKPLSVLPGKEYIRLLINETATLVITQTSLDLLFRICHVYNNSFVHRAWYEWRFLEKYICRQTEVMQLTDYS